MAAAAPGAGASKDGGIPRHTSRADLVKCWEYVFDNVGDEEAMELFMTLLLRDARQSRKEEEEERRARVSEPWQPTPPGSVPPPPRVERTTVVLGLRAPPHLLPRKRERTTTSSAPAADLGRPAKNTRGSV